MSLIEAKLKLALQDGTRRFELDLQIDSEGPVLALFGASGSGKTLSLQLLAGLRRPDSGLLRIAGRTLFDSARGIDVPSRERELGYVFQDYALFPHMSVEANIAFALTRWWQPIPKGGNARRVGELLDRFDLADVAKARPADLSGGQRQRVALARAVAGKPKLLLLDEPFAALDTLLRRELREQLKAWQRLWRIPMIVISHDPEDVFSLADQALVMQGGKVGKLLDLRTPEAKGMLG
jgi:molybdate transport system ATP-binding protein